MDVKPKPGDTLIIRVRYVTTWPNGRIGFYPVDEETFNSIHPSDIISIEHRTLAVGDVTQLGTGLPVEGSIKQNRPPLKSGAHPMTDWTPHNGGPCPVDRDEQQESDGPYTCIKCLASTWNDCDVCDDCENEAKELTE